MVAFAGLFASLILVGLGVFQILLILGFPLGYFAWGGKNKVLPAKLRISSFIAIALYALFALIILEKSEVTVAFPNTIISEFGIWILCLYFFIGTIMNAISRSNYEKYTMTPIAFILGVLCLFLALN